MLYAHVLKKAREFPENQGRARYEAAAQDFRMPYWDWGLVLPSGQSVLPTSLSSRTIAVVTPQSGGRLTTIDNPLYSYRFHPINPAPDDFPDNTVCLSGCRPGYARHPVETRADRALGGDLANDRPLAEEADCRVPK